MVSTGGSDQPSVDHKLVLYFLAAFDKVNLPKYLMHHLCWVIKEGIRGKRKQIPCGRLLSEIFTQGKLLKTLRRNNLASNKTLRIRTGKMINGKTLQNMKIIKKFSPNEKDLKESTAQTELMKDFPPIYQERNPEVLAKLIADFVKESGIILDDETPDIPDDVPLRVRGKRAKPDDGSEAAGVQTKKIRKAKKKKAFEEKYESPMFIMTPAIAKMAQEYADKMIADKKQQKLDYFAARDAKLKELGLDKCDEYFVQKIVKVRQIAGTVEQQAVEEAEEMMELIPEASEANASEAAIKSILPKVTQTSDLPSIIPTPLSRSNESDHDDIPLGQRMKSLPKTSQQPQQTTTQLPLQAEQSSAAAEGSEDPEEPNTCDLPKCDSPSNLFSLERHLGGEITKTPQKATKSVLKKIDSVNQQQPKQSHQTTPKHTSTQIQTQTQSPLQMAIPEPIVETVVPESVQVTESEPSMTITVSEPIQKPTQTIPTTITQDQPSSSSSIQTITQTPPNLLKSAFLEAEMQQINNELQKLVQLRRSLTLKVAYQDQWATLKNRASELLNVVSQKCIKIQTAAYMHHFSNVHTVEDQAPLLYLANTPYFP